MSQSAVDAEAVSVVKSIEKESLAIAIEIAKRRRWIAVAVTPIRIGRGQGLVAVPGTKC